MKSSQPSDTYKLLYDHIINDLLFQICSNTEYCAQDEHIPYSIWNMYEEYKNKALMNMSGTRLDRHKLASCICGAIIEAKPLTSINGKMQKNVNEIFALEVGINVIKFYMMCELLRSIENDVHRFKALRHLKEKFSMRFPSIDKNICDTQDYKKNFYNSLFWSHHKCSITQKECFHYDIWAYAKLFYHLELYNKSFLNIAYQNFIKEQEN